MASFHEMREAAPKCPCWKEKHLTLIHKQYIHTVCPTCRVIGNEARTPEARYRVAIRREYMKLRAAKDPDLKLITGPYYVIRGRARTHEESMFPIYGDDCFTHYEKGQKVMVEFDMDVVITNEQRAKDLVGMVTSQLYYKEVLDFTGPLKWNYEVQYLLGTPHNRMHKFKDDAPLMHEAFVAGEEAVSTVRGLIGAFQIELRSTIRPYVEDNSLCFCEVCKRHYNCDFQWE